MGFRNGAYATVWSVESISPTMTKVRLSISRKKKDSNEYVQDFGGFVTFFGTANADKAMKLKERDRIKLGDVDVSNKYDRDKNTTYFNLACYSFEPVESRSSGGSGGVSENTVASNDVESSVDDEDLPY